MRASGLLAGIALLFREAANWRANSASAAVYRHLLPVEYQKLIRLTITMPRPRKPTG
ncbi:hypothetical protein KCP74_21760 [Salmonella enterica subsp. enterica]|nr:hypothetical protein KCP74_21760 [Salmonella enterica subsp. enterica]